MTNMQEVFCCKNNWVLTRFRRRRRWSQLERGLSQLRVRPTHSVNCRNPTSLQPRNQLNEQRYQQDLTSGARHGLVFDLDTTYSKSRTQRQASLLPLGSRSGYTHLEFGKSQAPGSRSKTRRSCPSSISNFSNTPFS